MGTPDFAKVCLQAIVEAGHEIVGVVTQPDKPKGRSYKLTPPPVKVYAEEQGLPVYQPVTLKDEAFKDELCELSPEIIIVAAYGKILPKYIIDYPRYGCINAHGSVLPGYRGAAPIQRAIINGESETGITVMYMNEGLDTGDMILVEKTPITEEDNFETLHDRLAEIGGRTLVEAMKALENGSAKREKQDDSLATYAHKIEKEDCKIDFMRPATELNRRIRGVTPIPGAFCYQGEKMLKIFATEPTEGKGKPGEVIAISSKGEGGFTVACAEGALLVKGVIPEGKGRMSAGDYVRGRKINIGDILK